MKIFNVSDPSLLREINYIDLHHPVNDITVSGAYCYVADSTQVRVFNVADPTHLISITIVTFEFEISCVTVSDGNLVIAEIYNGITVMDCTDPEHLQQSVLYKDGYLYLSHGLEIYDVSAPDHIFQVASFKMNTVLTDILFDNIRNLVYGISDGGLTVFSIDFSNSAKQRISQPPDNFTLLPIYPNPFNTSTCISFVLPFQAIIHLSVHNVLGELVQPILQEKRSAGLKIVQWSPEELPSGLYFVRLLYAGRLLEQKCLYIK